MLFYKEVVEEIETFPHYLSDSPLKNTGISKVNIKIGRKTRD